MDDSQNKYIVGVEVGGGHISAALVTLSGEVLSDTMKYFKVDSGSGADEILNKWALPINSVLGKAEKRNVIGISFAMPGAFDYKNGIALFDGNGKYGSLYNVNIIEALSPRLRVHSLPPMMFVNDATAFAMGAAWKGETRDFFRSMSFTLGTGIGAAFIENGLPVVYRRDVPDQGCLWHLPFKGGIVDDYFSTRWFKQESELRYGIRVNGVKSLASAGRKHKHMEEIFAKFGQNLAELLIPWIEKFEPQCLCFGGNISQSSDIFGPHFQEELNKSNLQVQVAYSERTEELALIGSTRLFDQEVWGKIGSELPTI